MTAATTGKAITVSVTLDPQVAAGAAPEDTVFIFARAVSGPRMPLEFVVHKLTQDSARVYGLHDRGVIAPGYKADLNLIDYDALKLHAPEMVYDLPAGGKRLVQLRARRHKITPPVNGRNAIRIHCSYILEKLRFCVAGNINHTPRLFLPLLLVCKQGHHIGKRRVRRQPAVLELKVVASNVLASPSPMKIRKVSSV